MGGGLLSGKCRTCEPPMFDIPPHSDPAAVVVRTETIDEKVRELVLRTIDATEGPESMADIVTACLPWTSRARIIAMLNRLVVEGVLGRSDVPTRDGREYRYARTEAA